ncbi:MAG: helix-turn-helix domain-containing protein [Planctomycetota bacterium]|jgi:DNA-binding IclR family transcriptional regulator|nr:helix-turn-helix domain-containing protein [Planctomycetota bacterium]
MPHTSIQSLTRGLTVLNAVAESERGLGPVAIAEQLGVSPATAHNLIGTLIAAGWLIKSGRPQRLQLGPALDELLRKQRRRALHSHGSHALRQIAAACPRATAVVVEQLGAQLHTRLRIDPSQRGRVQEPAGSVFGSHFSAVTLCWLAFAPAPERALWERMHPLSEANSKTWHGRDDLEAVLERTREAGFVRVERDHPVRVAAPIFSPGGELVAVLGASLMVVENPDDTERNALSTAVCDAAALFTQSLAET